MEIPNEVVELVQRALHETVHGIVTTDAEVNAQMDLQEEALAALEGVTSQQPALTGPPAGPAS